MKKILFATALIGFAFSQTNAQNPAAVSTKKDVPAAAQATSPAMAAPKAAPQAAAKPAKVAPASVHTTKKVAHKEGAHGQKAASTVKENKDAAKPMAPASDKK